MVNSFKLHILVLLKHILSDGNSDILTSPEMETELEDGDEDKENISLPHPNIQKIKQSRRSISFATGKKLSPEIVEINKISEKTAMRRRQANQSRVSIYGEDLLDFEGPKLIEGIKNWLRFYQFFGQLNWIGKPLYLSIIYKFLVFALLVYCFTYRIVLKFYNLKIISEDYRNPIFLFISCIGFLTITGQVIVTLRTNLFDLCPLYKILITPKLCFVKREILVILGDGTLGIFLLALLFHTLLVSMIVSKDLQQFVNDFHLTDFLLDFYTNTVFLFYIIGLSHMDLYTRSAFGHWLLALRSHLEHRFTHSHRCQRRTLRRIKGENFDMIGQQQLINIINADEEATNRSFRDEYQGFDSGDGSKKNFPRLITFDMIQRNLNNMDDHLEVLRSVQISSMVLLSLNAFLVNGGLFLLSYHLLADQHNFYHGFLFLLLSLECLGIIFFCYSGDRWVYYALSSFVQTVEDEYFMQSDIKTPTEIQQPTSNQSGIDSVGTSNNNEIEFIERNPSINFQNELRENAASDQANNFTGFSPLELEIEASKTIESCRMYKAQQMLFIRKKDVLFCREFLHQFENHLATPWSKLTFITHLHMARTFVTLIAAQIIFDHEH